MSKKELKQLSKFIQSASDHDINIMLENEKDFKPRIHSLAKDIADRHNQAKDKEYEWMKWLIVIASGMFSIMVTQISRMSVALVTSDTQLFLLKLAITANALGIISGAVYLYSDVKAERNLSEKLQIQRMSLLVKGKNRYDFAISSDRFFLFWICKPISLICFLVVILIWVFFAWEM